ncbi:unnamed protein product [Pedinophyceae sp. YPF-701]|nr:unnamed protein product [Pedinophyceae sp. YPF-701]
MDRDTGAPRFFVPTDYFPRSEGAATTLEGQDAQHALRVLRMKPGAALDVCDGQGNVARCTITSVTRREAHAMAAEAPRVEQWRGPRVSVAVGVSTLKGGRADWLVEKLAELGAWEVVPFEAERCGKVPKGREGRLDRVSQAACQQCQRAHLMQVAAPASLAELCDRVRDADLALVAQAGGTPVLSALDESAGAAARKVVIDHPRTKRVLLVVGPEGDFTEVEIASLLEAGCRKVGLGPLRLRTETAAVAMLTAARLSADASGRV